MGHERPGIDRRSEIVIVEDDPNDAELIARVFRRNNLGGAFLLLKDGSEALDFAFAAGGIADNPALAPKVILLDLKLPKVDGIEVLHRLKSDERTRSIPVVVLTSSTEHRDLARAYALGVNSYVAKPVKFDEFARAMAALGAYWLVLNRLPR